MITYGEALADATPGQAFSNGTEWEIWQANWCSQCSNTEEVRFRETREGSGCPLVLVSLEELIPAQWVPDKSGRYRCNAFQQRK